MFFLLIFMAVNELVQKVKERTGQKKTNKMVPDTQVKINV